MTQVSRSVFLTLVLFALFFGVWTNAAVAPPTPNLRGQPGPPATAPSPQDQIRTQTIDIAPAPPLPKIEYEEEYFHRYRKSLTLHTGGAYFTRVPDEASDDRTPALVGAIYTFPDWNRNTWELGADLLFNGTGSLDFARRFNFSRTQFRPYGKVGAGLLVIPADQLVTFLRLSHYQLRAAAGFEQLLTHSRDQAQSLRIELETALSTGGTELELTLGYVWAW